MTHAAHFTPSQVSERHELDPLAPDALARRGRHERAKLDLARLARERRERRLPPLALARRVSRVHHELRHALLERPEDLVQPLLARLEDVVAAPEVLDRAQAVVRERPR